jgi:hypothetical protein
VGDFTHQVGEIDNGQVHPKTRKKNSKTIEVCDG